MDWYLDVLKNKYADFSGRARRKEYWMFFLFNMIVAVVLMVIDGVLGALLGIFGLTLLYCLAVIIPGLALTFRRLHDTNRSAWWILIGLVPAVGGLILLILMCLDGTPGNNNYGANPKG